MIASFLGIALQTLTTIRKQIVQKKLIKVDLLIYINAY